MIIATPVQFILIELEIFQPINSNKKKNIGYYKLDKIGKYNIENNILIPIPPNLSIITWWDGDMSVYTFKKCPDNNLWFESN